MKYRITHPDQYNWCIEEWQEGGTPISRGRYAGQLTEAKWMAPEAFYPSLKHAALGLIDKAAGDAMLIGEATTILEAIKVAERTVLATLAVMDMGIAQPSTLPELSCNEPSK